MVVGGRDGGDGGSGLEKKDNESWTMGRHEGWLGRCPSTVLVRDFAAEMNTFLLRSIKQRDRGQGEVTADGKMKSSRVLLHPEEKHNIILQDAELATVLPNPDNRGRCGTTLEFP